MTSTTQKQVKQRYYETALYSRNAINGNNIPEVLIEHHRSISTVSHNMVFSYYIVKFRAQMLTNLADTAVNDYVVILACYVSYTVV